MEPQGRLRGDGVLAVADVRDDIIAGTAGEGIIAVAALDDVIAGTAGDGVIAVAGIDRVVECRAGDGVITVAAGDRLARASIGAVDGVITARAGHRISGLCRAAGDDAINRWAGIRGLGAGVWGLGVGSRGLAAGGREKVAFLLVRGEGIPTDRDLHIRILCRPRALTDRHFVTFGGRFGCQCPTNGAGKRHADHRNSGNRS